MNMTQHIQRHWTTKQTLSLLQKRKELPRSSSICANGQLQLYRCEEGCYMLAHGSHPPALDRALVSFHACPISAIQNSHSPVDRSLPQGNLVGGYLQVWHSVFSISNRVPNFGDLVNSSSYYRCQVQIKPRVASQINHSGLERRALDSDFFDESRVCARKPNNVFILIELNCIKSSLKSPNFCADSPKLGHVRSDKDRIHLATCQRSAYDRGKKRYQHTGHSAHACHCIPVKRASVAQPPALAQSVQNTHSLIPLWIGRHSATPMQRREITHG